MTREFCPTCGQVVRNKRLGVYLSPRRAEIVDMVRGHAGIRQIEIARRLGITDDNVRSHVYHTNRDLLDSGWHIVSDGDGYYLERLDAVKRRRLAKIAP
jgi:hypothetical protein